MNDNETPRPDNVVDLNVHGDEIIDITESDIVEQLAALHPIDYDNVRKAKAKELGCRITTLDKAVKAARGDDDAGTGTEIHFHAVELWAEPVDGAAVLDAVVETIRRHVVLPEKAAEAVALWLAVTYLVDAIRVAPRLLLKSPQKRCGKGRWSSSVPWT